MSPMTVIAVVEVVGVSPSGHTSGAPPVGSVTFANLASGLSGLPVITIRGICGYSPRVRVTRSSISRVLPEFDMRSIMSLGCRTPRSPC